MNKLSEKDLTEIKQNLVLSTYMPEYLNQTKGLYVGKYLSLSLK